MTNRIARLLPSIAVGVFASLSFATMPLSAVGAADGCLTAPKGEAHAGQHWYYRIERGTKRHCWILRNEDETSSRATTSTSRRAAPEATASSETTLTRADADAHAEMPSPQTSVEDDPRVPPTTTPAPPVDAGGAEQTLPNNPSPESPRSLVASRWPESTGMSVSAGEPPAAPSFVVAAANANTNASADTDADLPTAALAAPAPMASVETPATGTLASLQMLLLVTFGALALTGLTGSAVYVLARARHRPQPYDGAMLRPEWPESADRTPPPWLEPLGVDPARDAEARSLEHLTRVSGIESLLARLASQSQTGS
jgi:hypothetical protein